MPRIRAEVDFRGIEDLLHQLAPKRRQAVLQRSLDRALTSMTKEAREVTSDMALRARDLKAAFRPRRRTLGGRKGVQMDIPHRPLPLIKFIGTRDKRPKGVVSKPVRSAKRRIHSRAFIARVRAGRTTREGVLERKGKARLPIRQLYGPSVSSFIGGRQHREAILTAGGDRLRRELVTNTRGIIAKERARAARKGAK